MFPSCSGKNKSNKKKEEINEPARPIAYLTNDSISRSFIDTNYLHTGFYFLAAKGEHGVKKCREHSNAIYALKLVPFASVENMADASIVIKSIGEKVDTALRFSMDSKGVKDLKKSTTDIAMPYNFAFVINNHLLYVIQGKAPIANRKMVISLEGYSVTEINKMIDAIQHKR